MFPFFGFTQVDRFNNDLDYLFFQEGTVVVFDGYLWDCLEEGQEFKNMDKSCRREKMRKLRPFFNGKISPLDFGEEEGANEMSYEKVKNEIKELQGYELCSYLQSQGFSIVNINFIKVEGNNVSIQYYTTASYNCIFTNVEIDINERNPKIKLSESGILRFKH